MTFQQAVLRVGQILMAALVFMAVWRASSMLREFSDHLAVAEFQIGRLDAVVDAYRIDHDRHSAMDTRLSLLEQRVEGLLDKDDKARIAALPTKVGSIEARLTDLHRRMLELERGR